MKPSGALIRRLCDVRVPDVSSFVPYLLVHRFDGAHQAIQPTQGAHCES